MDLLRKCVAELIGAFTLSFVGILAIHSAAGGIGSPVGAALAQGLAIGVMVAALGAISGGHFNPAVTLGFLVSRRLGVITGVAYWIAQLVGAALAALVLRAVLSKAAVVAGTPALAHGFGSGKGFLLEAIGTFFLVLVVFGTAVDLRAPAGVFPLAIGLTIAVDILAFGPLTGAAVNPSRWFGGALVGNNWTNGWVWIAGPLVGGLVAALVYELLFDTSGGGLKAAADAKTGQPSQSL